MTEFIEYRFNKPGYDERRGLAYDYVVAGNGVFIEAENPLLGARIPVAEVNVRGLPPLERLLALYHGKIPQRLWELALSVILAGPDKERYIGIRWQDGYQLYIPEQEGSGARVKYQAAEEVVIEMHSHPGALGPGFSPVDDADEQGLKVYAVVGDLTEPVPAVSLRVGVYGYRSPVAWSEIFEGSLQGVTDVYYLLKEGAE